MKFGVLSKVYIRQVIYHFEAWEVKNPTLQTVHKSELKWGSYEYLKQIGQRGKLSSKLVIWIWNGFWSFKTQRNARKLLENVKFESSYLFQRKACISNLKTWRFCIGNENFELTILISNWAFSYHLWVWNSFGTYLNFELNHWWSSLSSKMRENEF